MTRRAGLVLVAAGAWMFAAAPSAGAAPAVNNLGSTYWWEAEPSSGAVPGPPSVPPGGLWVSSDPAGPQSVSGVRFSFEAGATHPVLSLVIASAQPAASSLAGGIEACPATSAWRPGPGPGPWSARPTSSCEAGAAVGTVSQNGNTLSFDLSKLASGLTVDVVLQPVPGALGDPAFDATFQPVTAADIGLTVPAPVVTSPPEASTPVASAPALPAAPPVSLPAAPVPAALSPQDAISAAPVSGLTPVTAPAPSLAGTPSAAGPTTSGGGLPQTASPAAIRVPVRSWRDRLLLGLAVLDVAGYAWWSREKQLKAAPADAGTGRVGRPPPLR